MNSCGPPIPPPPLHTASLTKFGKPWAGCLASLDPAAPSSPAAPPHPSPALQSIDALCDALDEFTGGVVVISHDAQLLWRLCADQERSQVLIVDDGAITPYSGTYMHDSSWQALE